MSSTSTLQVLPPGAGYGIVVGIGGFFAALMLGITYLQNRYTLYSTRQAEEFNSASRSIKPGLIAAGIVSSWTWSATLLTSSTFAYSYGIGGPLWYGSMGTLQILLFALIAIKIKAKAPGAHTFPEIVLARHGKIAHATFLFNGLATNMLVGACLVLGGSQVVEALSGVNVYAACYLIPLVVAAYVIAGGLRSTFIADYVHTVILFVAIFTFGFTMYSTSDIVGSPSCLFDLLEVASANMPIAGNYQGSYLTFKSINGLVFAIDLLVAGFSTVWLDQAYWQRAIASRPETSMQAYLFGGMAWFGIPFGFATIMGLGCAGLTSSPSFPTYPSPLSATQNGAGLSSPATAIALLGKGGAALMLLLLFMAVTSSTSAELIAVSSLLTFDIYKLYFRPNATSTELVRISHYSIVIYAAALASFCAILNAVNVNLTWVLTVLGVIVGGASVPVGLILLWPRMSTLAAIASPWIGLVLGLIAWFVTTAKRSGSISVTTTGDAINAVAGNITSWVSGALFAVIITFLVPKRFESDDPAHLARADKINGISPTVAKETSEEYPSKEGDQPQVERENYDVPSPHSPARSSTLIGDEPSAAQPETVVPTGNHVVDFLEAQQIQPMDPVIVKRATRFAVIFNIIYVCIAVIIISMTFFGTEYVFSKSAFTGWVVVSFMWVFFSSFVCIVWPLWESRGALEEIVGGVWRDLTGGRR